MGRSHQRWAALAGAASVSMVGFGLLASAASADEPQAWPVVSQKSQDAYSLDGYELGRLPQGLADFGVRASSSNDNQGNRTSQISWVRGSAVYGQVTSLRSDAITNLDDLRAAQYGHLDSDSLQRVAIDGREAYHSTETGDLFWVEEPGSAVTVFLLPERWNSSELRDFATSIAGADAIDAAVEDAEESGAEDGADTDADAGTDGAEEDAPAEDVAEDAAEDATDTQEDAEGDADGTEEAPDAGDTGDTGEDAEDTTDEADQGTDGTEAGAEDGAEETDATEEQPAEDDASHDDADAGEEEPADEPAESDQQHQTDPVSNVGEDAPEAGTETDADTETETGADAEAETEAGTETDTDQAEDAADLTGLAPEELPDYDANLEEAFLDCVDQVLLEDAELTEGQTTQEALDGAAQVCAEELGIDTAESDQDAADSNGNTEDTKEGEGSRPSFWTLLPWA